MGCNLNVEWVWVVCGAEMINSWVSNMYVDKTETKNASTSYR